MKMKDYQLKKSDLIINTLITVSERENRRIIDTQDIFAYEELLRRRCRQLNFPLSEQKLDDEEKLKNYLYSIGEGLDKKYGVLPWVSVTDLYDTRLALPLDLCVLVSTIDSNMKPRSWKELKTLNRLEDKALSYYQKEVDDNELVLTDKQKKNLMLCKLYHKG